MKTMNINKQTEKILGWIVYFLGIGAIIFTVIMIILAYIR